MGDALRLARAVHGVVLEGVVHDVGDDRILPELKYGLGHVFGKGECGGGEDFVVKDAVCVCL